MNKINKKISSKSNSTESTKEEDIFFTPLIPCDYDSFDEDKNEISSSIDSSELVEYSDGETEIITYFHRLNKNLDKIDEKNGEL